MTVLYGTIEYFERQIANYLANNQTNNLEEDIWLIYSKLEKEIHSDNFLHDQEIQEQFLDNLANAVVQLTEKHCRS